MSEEKDREIAQRLILESIVDDKLDFNLLLRKTNDLAKKRADASHGKGNDFDSELKMEIHSLTYATRQVLGFIPISEDGYDDRPNWFTKLLGDKTVDRPKKTLADFQKEHGLEIYRKDGSKYVPGSTSNEPGAETDNSLSASYVITVSATKEKEIKAAALNKPAQVLGTEVKNARHRDSPAGEDIHETEAKVIKVRMQNFIGEFKKEPTVILTAEATKYIQEALTALEKADVKADYPELSKGMNDLQNILSRQAIGKPTLETLSKKPQGRQ